jgi:hypothetical protein
MPTVRISDEAYYKLNQISQKKPITQVLNELILQNNQTALEQSFKEFLLVAGIGTAWIGNKYQKAIDVLLNTTTEENCKPHYQKAQLTCYTCDKAKEEHEIGCFYAWQIFNVNGKCKAKDRFGN